MDIDVGAVNDIGTENMTVNGIEKADGLKTTKISDGMETTETSDSLETTEKADWNEGGEVEDDVNSGSEVDNGHVDIDLDKSEKNKTTYAKPKPGHLKAGKLTAAQILNK
ncbi:Hypothetical predicted protein [Mytilus galloprovincialis]|uniref:Uncharacterized protein n=1 Tax=Mytilus galloprovincialis TaxID=29158 RepID=A0A8B6C1U7_MYTGA|nr:Hypothetical predicted protein [Mytilus galloprovincialis]